MASQIIYAPGYAHTRLLDGRPTNPEILCGGRPWWRTHTILCTSTRQRHTHDLAARATHSNAQQRARPGVRRVRGDLRETKVCSDSPLEARRACTDACFRGALPSCGTDGLGPAAVGRPRGHIALEQQERRARIAHSPAAVGTLRRSISTSCCGTRAPEGAWLEWFHPVEHAGGASQPPDGGASARAQAVLGERRAAQTILQDGGAGRVRETASAAL